MFYSKSTGGFYTTEVHGDAIPGDAVEISEAEHAALLLGQSEGKLITGGPDGLPMLADQPLPAHAEQVEQIKANARGLRLPIMGILDGMQISYVVKGDSTVAQAVETAKQGLRDLTLLPFGDCPDYPAMVALLMARYKAIAGALPVAVQTAFASVIP